MDITATITGIGSASTVPDNDDAVDADIIVDNITVGSVTLLPNETGTLSTWGSGQDHWASHDLMDWLEDESDDVVSLLVDAVNAAV